MRFRITALLIASLVALGISSAQNPTSIKKVPLQSTSAASGKEMFDNYCAVCHGPDGKGRGPAATALKVSPADLTQLAAKNKGKFPEEHVVLILSANTDISAHGSAEMPIWGELFRTLGSGDAGTVRLRVVNLTYYVKSLQPK